MIPKWLSNLEEAAINDKSFEKKGCSSGSLIFHGYHNAIIKAVKIAKKALEDDD